MLRIILFFSFRKIIGYIEKKSYNLHQTIYFPECFHGKKNDNCVSIETVVIKPHLHQLSDHYLRKKRAFHTQVHVSNIIFQSSIIKCKSITCEGLCGLCNINNN